MHLLDSSFLKEVARVLAAGADKYSTDNWKKGMDWGRLFSAAQRHQWDWWDSDNSEVYDRESGLHHLAHAACNLMFLYWYELNKEGVDKRNQWRNGSEE